MPAAVDWELARARLILMLVLHGATIHRAGTLAPTNDGVHVDGWTLDGIGAEEFQVYVTAAVRRSMKERPT